ncbi:RNA polymerase sigma factor [Microbacterium memoriense]|uniref:Sigma-70 family RNA polymerase sigma factor n=1 Tax=Microbacterium memoriense TaxID=2978350 RepID=A0ABT2PDG7_9MICO|nr:sigma-70 family RNA polymerase sigma factor [Microbacterium memoriense]MCT9002670.1 sigma-70 family RNA polymerase sigma factor [Microbacterium memoriense]
MSDDHAWYIAEVACHADAIYRYFVRRTSRQDAEDLASDVFTTAWRRRVDVPRGAELPWLYKTAGFVLSNHRRRAIVAPVHALPPLSSPDHAEQTARSDELSRALALLKSRDREILMLHAWEGLDGNELAEALGVSRSGAQAALSRARARLRSVWRSQDEDRTGVVVQDARLL